jgi:hypothetical protein
MLVLLAACGRGHHEPLKMSNEVHAQLTSITDYGCELREAATKRPLEECASRDGRVHAWLLLDAGRLRGVTYELKLEPSEARTALRRALQGIIDDGLLETLCLDLHTGSPEWREAREARGQVHVSSDTRKVDIRWVYM